MFWILLYSFYFQFHPSIFDWFNFTLQSINFSCPLINFLFQCWSFQLIFFVLFWIILYIYFFLLNLSTFNWLRIMFRLFFKVRCFQSNYEVMSLDNQRELTLFFFFIFFSNLSFDISFFFKMSFSGFFFVFLLGYSNHLTWTVSLTG